MRSCYRGNLQQPVREDVTPVSRLTGHLPVRPNANSWETLTQETERSQENSQTANVRSDHIHQKYLRWSCHDTKILCTHSHYIYCTQRSILIPMIHGSSDHRHWIFIRESAPLLLFDHANQSLSTTAIKGTRDAAALWNLTGRVKNEAFNTRAQLLILHSEG